MSRLIDDAEEVRIVVDRLLGMTNLEELLGPLTPADRASEDLLLLDEGEEAEIDLIDHEGGVVATLLVDVRSDPVNYWRLGLRGWRLADDVASL